jgi:hypothetical protein
MTDALVDRFNRYTTSYLDAVRRECLRGHVHLSALGHDADGTPTVVIVARGVPAAIAMMAVEEAMDSAKATGVMQSAYQERFCCKVGCDPVSVDDLENGGDEQ